MEVAGTVAALLVLLFPLALAVFPVFAAAGAVTSFCFSSDFSIFSC